MWTMVNFFWEPVRFLRKWKFTTEPRPGMDLWDVERQQERCDIIREAVRFKTKRLLHWFLLQKVLKRNRSSTFERENYQAGDRFACNTIRITLFLNIFICRILFPFSVSHDYVFITTLSTTRIIDKFPRGGVRADRYSLYELEATDQNKLSG
jgi:hypothetical protein